MSDNFHDTMDLTRVPYMMYGTPMSDTLKTTVYLDTVDYRRLKALASAQGRTTAQLVREAVAEYTVRHAGQAGRPASIGVGRSGRHDLSARAEDLLRGMGRDE